MINEKDILAMLQNGEKADDIAQKLVDTLNSAKEKYDEELAAKAKADEEARIKAANEVEKQEDMADILDAIYQFVFKWYCEDDDDVQQLDKLFSGFTAKDVIKQVEEMGVVAVELSKELENLNTLLFANKDKKPAINFGFDINSKKDADFIINSFLKSIGL